VCARWTVALIAACVVAAPARAEIVGRVVAVHDGDTITVVSADRSIRVRLHGIDAPEREQPFANASRHALEAQVAGREVRVLERGRDGYGRLLGRVYVGTTDVNMEQVRSGYAWVFRRFVSDPALVALETEARQARRGLWRDPRALPPWQWRARRALQPTLLPRTRQCCASLET
jgi:micrococcal nuclease